MTDFMLKRALLWRGKCSVINIGEVIFFGFFENFNYGVGYSKLLFILKQRSQEGVLCKSPLKICVEINFFHTILSKNFGLILRIFFGFDTDLFFLFL